MNQSKYHRVVIEKLQSMNENQCGALEEANDIIDLQREYIEYLEGKLALAEFTNTAAQEADKFLKNNRQKNEK